MEKIQVIDVPLTKEHAEIILKALYFYQRENRDVIRDSYNYPGDVKVREEIDYINAILKFYEAAEVLNGRD